MCNPGKFAIKFRCVYIYIFAIGIMLHVHSTEILTMTNKKCLSTHINGKI